MQHGRLVIRTERRKDTLRQDVRSRRTPYRCYTDCTPPATRIHRAVSYFLLRLLAIAVCGGGGALIAWWLVSSLGWTGVGGGVASAMIGMVLALLLWVGGVALIGTLKRDQQAK
jgi:hypothetical protein